MWWLKNCSHRFCPTLAQVTVFPCFVLGPIGDRKGTTSDAHMSGEQGWAKSGGRKLTHLTWRRRVKPGHEEPLPGDPIRGSELSKTKSAPGRSACALAFGWYGMGSRGGVPRCDFAGRSLER